MLYNRWITPRVLLVVALSLVVGNAGQRLASRERFITLPLDTVVSDGGAPLLDSTAGVGFISSVIPGSLISFSLRSGQILASAQFGEMACAPSMVEVGAERLIALPTSSGSESSYSPSVSVINATKADQFERISLVALPKEVRLNPSTRALLTTDGRFGVIAASSAEAALFSFNVQTGQIVSRIILFGDPTGIALTESATGRIVAVANPKLNNVFISKLDAHGQLEPVGTFIPVDAQFESANQPEFGLDGRNLYIAASKGDRLYAIDASNGLLQDSVTVSAPQTVTIARGSDGAEIIGVTRLSRSSEGRPGGVTILTNTDGRLLLRAEFSPSNEFQFSSSNNVVFSSDASLGFVGSASGILFSFDTATAKLVGFRVLGGELRRLLLSQTPGVVLAVRATLTRDDIALVDIDRLKALTKTQALPRLKPEIKSVTSEGTYVHLLIEGVQFRPGSLVQFLKEGAVVIQQSAVRITENQISVVIPAKRLKELGRCEIRVVTGTVMATDSTPLEPVTLLSKTELTRRRQEPTRAQSEPIRIRTPSTGDSSPAMTSVNSVHSETNADSMRVIIGTSAETKIHTFALTDPFRIVVDLFNVRNGLGTRTTPVSGTLVHRIRIGSPKPGVTRIVLDAKSKVQYEVTRNDRAVEVLVRESLSLERANSIKQ